MSPIFRQGRGPYALAIAMTGVKLGERLLHIGAGTPAMFAALAAKVGLSGRAVGVAPDQNGADALDAAATNAGVLVETQVSPSSTLQFEREAFDLIIVDSTATEPDTITPWLSEAARVLRGGGRAIVAERVAKRGLAGLFSGGHKSSGPADAASNLLLQFGFRPVRIIAEREGWRFTEGMKPAR